MRLNRAKNAKRNIIYGTILKVYQVLLPFLIRTVMIYYLGLEYVGVNSLFTSILQVLNLAELGVGSAMVFCMYKPIADNDESAICALMRLYRKYYRVIGAVILAAGLCLMPFLKYLVKGSVPDHLNLYILYLMNLGTTVLSYWLFAYRNCLFNAFQRTDITSKISIVISTVEYAFEIAVMVLLRSYYFYLIIKLFAQVFNNIAGALVSKKTYPSLKPIGQLKKDTVRSINQKVKDLFTAKVGAVIVNSADSIVISAFLGLTVLAIYNNYYYIITSVIGFITIVYNACTAGIGNSLLVESTEKNYSDFKKFTFLIAWLGGFCTCCCLCLFQPFMLIWVKKTSAMFGIAEVICFCIYLYVYLIIGVMLQYKDAAGIWHEDRFRPLATAMGNLLLNLITVQFIGIFGVLLSTVISFVLIGIPWLIKNLFSLLFKRSPKDFVIKLLYYTITTVIVCGITYYICGFIHIAGLVGLVIKAMVCCIVSNLLFLILFLRLPEYGEAKQFILRLLSRNV